MTNATDIRGDFPVSVSAGHRSVVRRPAAWAAMRCAGAGAVLGALGVASALLVVMRLLESWHLEPGADANRVSVFGAHMSYPTANAAAVVVLCQAALGFAALSEGGRAALRELRAARRFNASVRTRVAWVLDDVLVIDHERPVAFCAGLFRPRVYVSTAAVETLDQQALSAVLDHERAHRHRHDPLRLSAGRVLVRALFFVPGVRKLAAHHESLAELSADEFVVAGSPHARRALARAMLAFDARPSAPQGVGIDPARIDALLGRGPGWRFPILACLPAAAIVVVMILTGVLIGRVATGAATLALPVLSRQPCVLTLALMPVLLIGGARQLSRRRSAQ
jgi:hypothetical protein